MLIRRFALDVLAGRRPLHVGVLDYSQNKSQETEVEPSEFLEHQNMTDELSVADRPSPPDPV